MQLQTHLRIGVLLADHLKEQTAQPLHLSGFLFGNIKPDLNWQHFVPRKYAKNRIEHYLDASYEHVSNLLSKAMLNIEGLPMDSPEYAVTLGELSHYFSDFFCFAHGRGNCGSFLDHLAYEARFAAYFAEQQERFGNRELLGQLPILSNPYEVLEYFNILYAKYNQKPPSYELDALYLLKFNLTMISSIVVFNRSLSYVA